MSLSNFLKTGLVVLAFCVCTGAFAASWITNGPKRDIVTLVVTANYKNPRLMAELILNESRQPYLLLPTPQSKLQKIIFVQPKGPALEIAPGKLKQYLSFLNPRRIVVLGDERYVSDQFVGEYLKKLETPIPVVRVEGNDWNRIAEETTYLLSLSHLGDNFKRLRQEMENNYRATRRTMQQQQQQQQLTVAEPEEATDDATVTEETVVEDETVVETAE